MISVFGAVANVDAAAPLLELGMLSHEVRSRWNDPRLVTYILDTNPNYTVCPRRGCGRARDP